MHRGQLVEDRRQNSWRTHLSGRVLEGKNQASFFLAVEHSTWNQFYLNWSRFSVNVLKECPI